MKTEKLYQNKEWLRGKYWDEELSLYKIGKLCKVDHRKIWYWMKRLNIPRRSRIPDNTGYKNKNWLYNKYCKEGLTTIQIGKLYGVYDTIIGRYLKKFKIPSRSREEAAYLSGNINHCNLSQEAKDWISGEMLADGSIQNKSNYSACFVYGSKYLEYIKYIKDTLKSFGIEGEKIRKRYHKKNILFGTKRNYYSYFYRSHSYVELMPFRNKWYPKGEKIIPKDLKLNPTILKQQFIGDGSLAHPKQGKPYIFLYTNGFTIPDVNWLTDKINKLGFKATRQPAVNSIRIFGCSTKEFLNYIGRPKVQCYQYKWALERR